MALLIKSTLRIFTFLVILLFLIGCTEIGDVLAIEYALEDSKGLTLEDLDGDFLPKKGFGFIAFCHDRADISGTKKMAIGVCFKETKNKIVVYRAFSSSLRIKSKGITKSVRQSQGFSNLLDLSKAVDKVLVDKKIAYKKTEPVYVPRKALKKTFDL